MINVYRIRILLTKNNIQCYVGAFNYIFVIYIIFVLGVGTLYKYYIIIVM